MSVTLQEAQRAACAEVGVKSRDVPVDGQWHSADIKDDNRGHGDGRIRIFPDGQGGIVHNWKENESKVFFTDDGRQLSEPERRARKTQRAEAKLHAEEDQERRRADAAAKAAAIWNSASPVLPDHPYLVRKQVQPVASLRELPASDAAVLLGYAPKSGGEELAGRLIVARVQSNRKLSTLELIDEAGRKSAIAGGAKAGGFWAAQRLPDGDGAGLTVLVAEGVATALSAGAASGHPVIAALSSGNLEPVARMMRERYPVATIVVLADLGNGQSHAEQAARTAGALLALPRFGLNGAERASDFNDMVALCGADAVVQVISGAVAPATTEPAAAGFVWSEPQALVATFEPEPYPIDALPAAIRLAVEEVQGFIKAPIPMVAASALAAVSLAGQAYVDVQRCDGLAGPTGLFLLSIADSGERKSTCDKYFTAAIREYERREAELAKPDQVRHRAELKIWEAKRSGLSDAIKRASAKGATGDLEVRLRELEEQMPTAPRVPRLIYGDATPEAQAWELAHTWPSGGVMSSEAGAVFGSHGMGAESQMRNLAILNVLWDGTAQCFDRRKDGNSYKLDGARFTMGLQVQEAALRSFFDRTGELARGTGFLARFLVAWPESTQGSRPFAEPPSAWPALAAFHRRIDSILSNAAPVNADGGLAPTLLTLTPEAKASWVAYHDVIEAELRAGGELHDVRDVASKSADNAARLAAQFHVFEHGPGGAVGHEAFEGASRIAAWHLNESRRFFGELALTIDVSNATRLDAWLIAYCRRSGTNRVPRREVQRHVTPARLRGKAALCQALLDLTEAGRAQEAVDGKRKDVLVHPALVAGDVP